MPWRSTFDAVPDFTPLHLATALWARAGEDSLKQHEVRGGRFDDWGIFPKCRNARFQEGRI